jgi:hypothetical protein
MTKALRFLSLAAALATGVAPATLAANNDSGDTGSQAVTGTQLRGQQQPRPATGSGAATAGNPGANTYPGGVGPTGSRQSDATNPNRTAPSGGQGGSGSGSGNK